MQTTSRSEPTPDTTARPAPRVAVVVATKDRAELLRALLGALERQTLSPDAFEVLVVDDGSRDATPELLAAAEDGPLDVRAFRQPESRGPAAARNRGWQAARAPLVAFTDDDCEPVPAWLESLLGSAAERPGAIVQGMTVPNPAEAATMSVFTRSLEVTGPSPHYQTANILYPRRLLEELGGFDEDYGAPAGEDTDLGWRARDAGAETVFVGGALVYHAVHRRSPRDTLKDALRAADCVKPYRDHPGLRSYLFRGLFFDRSHPLLALAAVGAVAATRTPAAAVLAAPYVIDVARRSRAAGSPVRDAPMLAMRDAVELASTIQGAVRHRVPVL